MLTLSRCSRHLALFLSVAAAAAAQPTPAKPTWATLQVPAGFEVTPVAGAPLINFPMLGGFDDRGRLFIAENAGVNFDDKELQEKLPSRITMLEDTDGDGVFDRSSVFADKLAFPQGAAWHEGALYVTSAPSIWRLEDTDGDGRADSRRVLATGFKSTGNAADVHGPFLHPNGRLYWCHGRKGHEVYQNGGGALVSKGLGARIWSCRPDGTDIQVHAGGGMDNPVEVAFNQEGEVFGTANIFVGTPRSDAVIHWVHGGTYPRIDQEPVLAEFKRTGELLPPVALIGHVAPSGIALPRSDTWGTEYRHNLFYAEFNTRRIMRVPLEASGASYRGHQQVFASTAESGVHFTDVIEDADGSLLVVNTGAWFRRGCPTSVVARADIGGGIYRIRRTGAKPPADPRGNAIKWTSAEPAALTELLGDPRFAVRDRAVSELARRGEAVVAALDGALGNKNSLVRSNAVWALTRIGSPAAQTAARRALRDGDARVRVVACQSAFITTDREAAVLLVAGLGDDSLAVQRESARALGRLRNAKAVPALGGAAAIPRDPMLTHALIYALIEIDAPAETRALLDHREPLARRAALIALDRSASGKLESQPVFAALKSTSAELRSAALQVAVRHPEWGRAAADYLAAEIARANEPAARDTIARLLSAFLPAAEVREFLRSKLSAAGGATALDPQLLLESIASSPGAWDESWRDLLVSSLRSSDPRRAQAALRAIGVHRTKDFGAALQEVGRDPAGPTAFRVAALQLAAGADSALDDASFQLLLEPLVKGGQPDARLQAATVMAGAKLTREQLSKLADILPSAGPVELQQLLGAFQRGPADAKIGTKLLAQLQVSPGRWGVLQQTLQAIFQRYPAPAYENAAPMISEIMNQNVAKDGRVAELEILATGGDPARGKASFLAGAGACLSCHRVGDTGGTLGPDLSHIGRIRNIRDLLEAISFPSATIARGYDSFQITTSDGRSLMGTIPREAADTVFVVTADGRENPVQRAAIAKLDPVAMSLMPPGLDRVLEPKALADMVAYLKSLE
ncbi:MAG: HEAT repeat domain-containing protein [Opitutaceae bacterium]|nr:HEAT repeat domain-containing protein [Opitutaceae bacterium]